MVSPAQLEGGVRHDDAIARDYGDINPSITDHEVAQAIRDGRVASPQRYGEFWLFDLRITGTGMAYRDALEEWAFRDPALWLTDEFVERCNGLAVVFEHPERSGLDHAEWRERGIGTIVLPYIKGDEVWGIAKIFDSDAATLMQTTHVSTSPGVKPPEGSLAIELNDGTKVLAEGLPLVLDHLAVCEVGVWDKDGPPEGVRLDSTDRKDSTVEEKDDWKKRFDSMSAEERADARRILDAAEKGEESKDDSKKDAAPEPDKKDDSKKDESEKEKDEDEKDDAKEGDEDDDEDKEEKKDAKARKDGAKTENVDADPPETLSRKDAKKLLATVAAQSRELDALRSSVSSIHRQPTPEDANALAESFHRADSLYQMLGEPTPRQMIGETPIAYRKRAADGLRTFTKSWKEYHFHDAQQARDFKLVEDAIYAEALDHAKNPPESATTGRLREVLSTDQFGRKTISFIGDAGAAWRPFEPAVSRQVVSVDKDIIAQARRR